MAWGEYRKVDFNIEDLDLYFQMDNVSWYDAKEFIKRLNVATGVYGCEGTPKDPSGCYRLPTEAEYEWAIRAGTNTAYFFGNDVSQLDKYAVYENNLRYNPEISLLTSNSIYNNTHEVTTGRHNPNKLHGIIGNVWEWTEDTYSETLPGGEDPLHITYLSNGTRSSNSRVVRGGDWNSHETKLRSATRYWLFPEMDLYNVGFRIVRTL